MRAARAGLIVSFVVAASGLANGAGYGRLAGVVRDQHGNPLMGATVVLTGPEQGLFNATQTAVERVTTDAYGRFSIRHLAPGWYSLQVISPTYLPAMRNRVQVSANRTADQDFVLGGLLSNFQPIKHRSHLLTWGEDWKWILRTSASTRPVLRFQQAEQASLKKPNLPSTPSQHFIGVLPGSARQDELSEDPGVGSVLAYLRPLSQNSDLLVVGSLGSSGTIASSFAAALRRNMISGDPQEISIAVHQLNLDQGMAIVLPADHGGLASAQGMVVTYSRTSHLSQNLTMTTGFEADYLNSVSDVGMVQPRLAFAYRFTPSTRITFGVGAPAQTNKTFVGRLNTLGAFPRITIHNNRVRMENVQHAEAAIEHRWGTKSRIQLAAYSDFFHNAALWASGGPSDWVGMAGNYLPNTSGEGVVLNAGNYRSSGLRVEYERRLGANESIAVMYSLGDALAPKHSRASLLAHPFGNPSQIASRLAPERAQAISGRITTRLPLSKTEIVTSYTWLTAGTVTLVDPYGMAQADMEPYLGVEIRQPLPTMAFLPAHIEALAEFRNALDQGSVPLNGMSAKPILLTPAYRTLRGGFSVQF